jgi:predicted negative regulator of RcsB-dependent stress response
VDDLLSEKEQIEQMRSWWSEYGGYVIGGLGLGIALLAGWNYYQGSRLDAQLEGSVLYESLTGHVVSGRLDEAEAIADQLATDYVNTSYAAQAQLAMARLYMDKNRDQDAADALGAVLDSTADEEVKLLARARLGRVLLYQGKPQEVVDLLADQESTAFAAIFSELLGDAHHALGQAEEAQAAYSEVLLDPLSRETVDQQLVQWKALDLPEIVEEDSSDTTAQEALNEEPAAEEAVEATEAEESE